MFTYFAEGSFKILVGFGLLLQISNAAGTGGVTLFCKVFDADGINYPVKYIQDAFVRPQ
ncbi:MAG: hypothetical protein ABIU09_13075 [Pyrinomonadaceae bacterium]